MWKKVEKGIYQRGSHSFRVRMMANGHRLDRTLDSLIEARLYRDSHKISQSLDPHETTIIEARIKKQSIKSLTVSAAFDRYLREVTALKKGQTAEEYRIGKILRTTLAKKPLHGVTPEDVISFLTEIGGSENNQRKYASLVSHLYRTATRKWRLPVSNPVAGQIDLPSNGKPRDRRLYPGEYEKLIAALHGEARSFFILAIETAMRRSEIFKLRWETINRSAGTAVLKDTKNGESRTTVFSDVALNALDEIDWKKRGPVWTISESQLRRQWEHAKSAADAHDLHFHDLRHEGTSRLFERGLNVFEVQSVTGHKTLSELRKYTHLSPSLIREKLNKAAAA